MEMHSSSQFKAHFQHTIHSLIFRSATFLFHSIKQNTNRFALFMY